MLRRNTMVMRLVARSQVVQPMTFRPVLTSLPYRGFAKKDDPDANKSDQELFEEQAKKKRKSPSKKVSAASDVIPEEETAPVKKKRRTKAEIEADKAEKAL